MHRFVCKHGVSSRKVAVTCKPLFHQGRGLSKNKIARLDFEKKCGVHRFCSDAPCCVVKIRSAQGKQPFGKPNGGKREISRDFSRFFRPCFFLKKYRSIFQTIRNTVNCSTANPKTKPNCSKHFRMSRKNCSKSSAPQKSN